MRDRLLLVPCRTSRLVQSSYRSSEGIFSGKQTMSEQPAGSDDDVVDTRELVKKQNRKNKKSGGFQSMGLSHNVFKGLTRKGYKIPTPIQRKTIPLIMDGQDVVAMARTGSGKTAAFLLPLFEKLNRHSAKQGARALIMSPTRELALQTLKFTKELGRFTGLRAAVILGGDRMDDQFAAIHENPDVIIATPGRFMHVVLEMELKLKSVEYVVFDEADRLFELGFQTQLHEVLSRLPESRQTLLFSATLPKMLVDFAKAGLSEPTLIRLDVDNKLSPNLRLAFLHCRADDKLSALLFFLKNVIKPTEQTLVFAATKHHVEYLNMVLRSAGFKSTYIYSSLDQTARKINIAKFQHQKAMILVVTDLAARGIDIPMLDNVINFNFPAKPKLFIHRVGRVARAGRTGCAYSLVGNDEVAHVVDLHLFLGRPLQMAPQGSAGKDLKDGLYGAIPQTVIDGQVDEIRSWHATNSDLVSMTSVIENAYKMYLKSRPLASSQSIKRSKDLAHVVMPTHPIFRDHVTKEEDARTSLLETMKSYKPKTTIFEINANSKNRGFDVMKSKREWHSGVINANKYRTVTLGGAVTEPEVTVEGADDADVNAAFVTIIHPRASDGRDSGTKKKRKRAVRDVENFVSYTSASKHEDEGLAVGDSFNKQAEGAVLDLTGDDTNVLNQQNRMKKWDRKRKRFVQEMGKVSDVKKIQTESGQWIAATYKSSMYKDWLKRNKVDGVGDEGNSDSDSGEKQNGGGSNKVRVMGHTSMKDRFKAAQKSKVMQNAEVPGRQEIKRREQIVKQRKRKAQKEAFSKRGHAKDKRRAISNRKNRK